MSLLKLATSGSGIELNPKNKGKFTEYCKNQGYRGVTEQCIRDAKKTGDTTLIRRATFAWNARHRFKH